MNLGRNLYHVQHNKMTDMIGLSAKARKCVSGETGCMQAIRTGKAKLIIISSEASENTTKQFLDKSDYRNIPFIILESEMNLGHLIGKYNRMVVAIIDEQFANIIIHEHKAITINNGGGYNVHN